MKSAFIGFAISTCLLLSSAEAASSLSGNQRLSLDAWLSRNPQYTIATEQDCDCGDDIEDARAHGPYGKPLPDFQPSLLAGDFRKNGQSDFAVVVKRVREDHVSLNVLLIFDGPFVGAAAKPPVFVHPLNRLRNNALFQSMGDGYPIYGAFESEGCAFVPRKRTYIEDCTYP